MASCKWSEIACALSGSCDRSIGTDTNLASKACLYIANAAVRNPSDPDWKFYYLLSMSGYLNLTAKYPFTRVLFTSLLSIAVSRGRMPITAAKRLHDQMVAVTSESDSDRVLANGKLVVDQKPAMNEVKSAHMNLLADELAFKMACNEFLEHGPSTGT